MKRIKLSEINIQEVEDTITQFITNNVVELNKTGAVLGLSGGVDSTLSAIYTKKAFDKHNQKYGSSLELKGFMLPSKVNNSADLKDAEYVATRLGIDTQVIEIEPFVKVYDQTMPQLKKRPFDRGNLMSRIRANILHTEAALENKLVVGTGNKDEDFALGYYTLFGDGAVHLSPLGDLAKRQVKVNVAHYGFKDAAIREPTAGLEDGQTDFKDLGYTYETAELVIEGKYQGITIPELKTHNQVIGMVNQYLKNSKFNNTAQIVDDIMLRHNIALKKAELLSPPIAKVNKKYI